jgi:ABC-type Zn uptake system ZnuABC Zn-binding protein ZnuA
MLRSLTRARATRAAVLVLPLALLAACGGSDTPSATSPGATASTGAGDRMQLVTTVAPITSIASNIVGDRADVTGIVPEGTNSHTFEPPPQVSKTMATADVVFVNGLQLEEPTFELAEQNAPDDALLSSSATRCCRSRSTSTTSPSRRRTASPTRTCGPIRPTR